MLHTRSFRLWLALTLVVLAPASVGAMGAGENAETATLETTSGLHTATFTTPEGTIKVHLPDDMAAGDSISGTVIAEAEGKDEAERTENEGQLNGYVVELERQPAPADGGPGRWTIPAGIVGLIPVILRDPRGREVGRVRVPVQPPPDNARPSPAPRNPNQLPQSPPPPGMLQIPTVAQPGKPIEIRGAFDGNSQATDVRINGNDARVLAESPRKAVVQAPENVVGPAEIEIAENGVVTRCRYRSVGVRLAAGKTNLVRGERTTFTATARGLDDLDQPVALEIENKTPGTVRLDGGDRQVVRITPAEVGTNGTYALTRSLTGVSPGGFNISATVRAGNQTSICAPVPPQREGVALDPGALPRMPGASPPRLEPRRDPSEVDTYIAPPHSLRTTIDPKLCADKVPGGILFCKPSIEKGDAVLVWDWAPPLFPPEGVLSADKVDGYRVYRVGGGSAPALVATQPDQASQGRRFAWVPGQCYVVRAYYATVESKDSNSLCLGPPENRFETTVLRGSEYVNDPRRTIDHATFSCFPGTCGGMSMGLGFDPPPPSGLLAGFWWAYDNGTPPCNCWEGIDRYYWSAVRFDLASIPDLESRLKSVTFEYRNSRPGCELEMGLAEVAAGHVGGFEAARSLSGVGEVVTTPVADLVLEILRGASPPYFAFRSAEQGSRVGLEKENGGCVSALTDLQLRITLLKKP